MSLKLLLCKEVLQGSRRLIEIAPHKATFASGKTLEQKGQVKVIKLSLDKGLLFLF